MPAPVKTAALLFVLGCAPAVTHRVHEDVRVDGNPELRREAVRHTYRLAGLMGFERYILVIRYDTLPGEVIARFIPRPDVRGVIIPLDVRFFGEHREQICTALAHELLHSWLWPLRQFTLSLIHPADTITQRQYALLEESAISDKSRLAIWGC